MARRSGDPTAGTRALHLVSAFLVREGLTPPACSMPDSCACLPGAGGADPGPGAVVTIDDAGCQTAIVQALRATGADYVLAVKRNQRTLHKAVKAAFDDAERGTFRPQGADRCQTVERNGGRTERRRGTVLGGPGLCEWVADPTEWPGLHSLIRVQAERTGPRTHRQRSVRHCISSRPVDTAALLALVRGHWGAGMACTASWTCNSGRTTAASARATAPPSWASCAGPP